MGRAEEAGEPPRPDSPPIQHGERPDQATAPASTSPDQQPLQHADTPTTADAEAVDDLEPDESGDGLAISDRQLRALEAEVAAVELDEQDFSSTHEQVLAERAQRRVQQQQLVMDMRTEGFDGPITQTWKAETVAYALAVIMSWTRTGQIVKECRAKGRPITLTEYGPGRWSREDRLELAGETVTRALEYFMTKVLAADRWDPAKGASLNTFFIGACLFQFPNVYDRWAREHRDWDRTGASGRPLEDAESLMTPVMPWEDPTSKQVLKRTLRRELLQQIANPQTHAAAEMILADKTIKETAAALEMNEKTLRTRLSRLKGTVGWDLAQEGER
jgi:DNA-directed RNA polymerase specialized sigma24 family protein